MGHLTQNQEIVMSIEAVHNSNSPLMNSYQGLKDTLYNDCLSSPLRCFQGALQNLNENALRTGVGMLACYVSPAGIVTGMGACLLPKTVAKTADDLADRAICTLWNDILDTKDKKVKAVAGGVILCVVVPYVTGISFLALPAAIIAGKVGLDKAVENGKKAEMHQLKNS
jgi:hypothetical protein